MSTVRLGNQSFELLPGETVLDGLLRNGVPVSYACKAGACGSCLLRAAGGQAPADAQVGLKESWKAQGYLLACLCRPETDLTLEQPGADARAAARIHSLDWLSHDVRLVRLACLGASFEFRAGQYVTLRRQDGLARSYSIASLPGEDVLDLHVRRIPGGKMSEWLAAGAAPGDHVELTGPAGDCFYLPGRDTQPLLLAGTGTGLAPLYGIVRDALARGHQGPVHLFHGALRPEGLYLRGELTSLAGVHSNFTYTPTVVDAGGSGGGDELATGSIDAVVLNRHPKLNGWRGFVCGDPALVRMLKKKLFLAGMALGDIHSDAFLPSVS